MSSVPRPLIIEALGRNDAGDTHARAMPGPPLHFSTSLSLDSQGRRPPTEREPGRLRPAKGDRDSYRCTPPLFQKLFYCHYPS
jgi:hypothetical protein